MDEEWFAARGLFNRGLNNTGCLVTIDLEESTAWSGFASHRF